MRSYVRYRLLIALVITGPFLFDEILFSSDHVERALTKMNDAFSNWRSCMEIQLDMIRHEPLKMWVDFPSIASFCTTTTEVFRIKLYTIKNRDEDKHCIPSYNNDPSIVVTLGVGADISAEQQLQRMLPKGSEFFGADPVAATNADIFSEIGLFFPVAVNHRSGLSFSNVRLHNGTYKKTILEHVHFLTFLTKMVNRSRIDFLFMDVENPEYHLIPMIAIDNIFSEHNIVICQINVEFHAKQGHRMFPRLISEVVQAGRYAAIRSFIDTHQRVFLVNYHDTFCVRKYLLQYF